MEDLYNFTEQVTNNGTNSTKIGIPFSFQEHKPGFIFTFCVITIVAVIGNCMVISNLCLNYFRGRSMTYWSLINLSFSDLIFAIMSPIHVHTMLNPGKWILSGLGNSGCKVFYFLFRSMYAFSVLILVAISVQRFVAIHFPMNSRGRNIRSLFVIIPVWILSFLFNTPLLTGITLYQYESYFECIQGGWASPSSYKAYYIIVYITLYILPLIVLLVLHTLIWRAIRKPPRTGNTEVSRRIISRRRMANLLMLIVFLFFCSWTPWNIVEAISVMKEDFDPSDSYLIAVNYAMLPVFASSAVNPVLYLFMSEDFMGSALNILFRRSSKRITPSPKNGSPDPEVC